MRDDYVTPSYPYTKYEPPKQESAKPEYINKTDILEEIISNPLHVIVFRDKVIVITHNGEVHRIER